MKKGVWLLIFTLLLFVTLVSSVYAFGVAQDYVQNQTLYLIQDGVFELNLYLQNPTQELVPVKLEVSGDIVEVLNAQEYYNLSPKTYQNKVTLLISAPNKASPGDVHLVRYSITPFQEQQGSGQLGMRTKISRSLTVVIVDEHGVGEIPQTTLQKLLSSKTTTVVVSSFLLIVLFGLVLLLLFKKSISLSKFLVKAKQVKITPKKKKSTLPSGLSKKEMHTLTEKLKRCKTDKEYEKVLQNAWKKKK